jgi:hypothetical protein
MSNLFAFTQAVEAEPMFVPAGRYDAEQQVWIADETSYASEIAPVDDYALSKTATAKVTGGPSGMDGEADVTLDF